MLSKIKEDNATTKLNEQKIINTWKTNVEPWVSAVRNSEIESRILVSNKAIINTILKQAPKTVLDLGCGEGWLVRELEKSSIASLGIDVVAELIESAKQKGGGNFRQLSFDDLANNAIEEKFDVVVCNFSLIGKESVRKLFQNIPSLLNLNASFIIQTINPISKSNDYSYKDGWRKGSWDGFSKDFKDPAPWYFRTLETWKKLFLSNGLEIKEIIEPINPKTKSPASIIFVAIAQMDTK